MMQAYPKGYLGLATYFGSGGAPGMIDIGKASEYAHIAALWGDPHAQFRYADMWISGVFRYPGVRDNGFNMALIYFTLAADQGVSHPDVQELLKGLSASELAEQAEPMSEVQEKIRNFRSRLKVTPELIQEAQNLGDGDTEKELAKVKKANAELESRFLEKSIPAVQNGNMWTVRFYLEQGHSPNQPWGKHSTLPLVHAAAWNQYEVAELLLRYGADPNAASAAMTPLFATSMSPAPA